MVLEDWLEGLGYELVQGGLDREMTEVVHDSRKVISGAVFVCMAKTRVDSRGFVPQVLKAGARVLATERGIGGKIVQSGLSPEELTGVTVFRTEDGRRALAPLSTARFSYSTRKMITIGATGTKGKTTATYMIKAMLKAAGKKVGMTGTTGIVIGDTVTPIMNTTPESWQLHQAFSQMAKSECQYMIMEVSSRGIKMHRVDGITFDYGIFTNISLDHIGPDEHADFEEYLYYKSRVLDMCKVGLADANDSHFKAVVRNASCAIHTYSVLEEGEGVSDADFTAPNIRHMSHSDFVGTEFDVKDRYEIDTRLGIPGLLNVDNTLAAVSIYSFLNLSKERISHALKHVRVNGRVEIVYTSVRCTVLVGYVHNTVSMESLLSTLRQYHPKRLMVVSECGGDRSKERRYSMSKIGGRLADLSIVTTDNSRFEGVEDIVADIRGSIKKTEGVFVEIPGRWEAIEYSIAHAWPGDMVAVIGKGHEDYQEINGVHYHFLSKEIIEEVVNRLGDEAWR